MAHSNQRGDTLVEVLMAIVVLSMVIVGAITLMTRGIRASQLAVEHTQVRMQINSQMEILRYLRDAYVSDPASSAGQRWSALFTGSPLYASAMASTYSNSTCGVSSGKTGFYLTQTAGAVTINQFNPSLQPATHAVAGRGLWVEMTRSTGISPAYVDIMFKACWDGIGDSASQRSVTAMRLYDPAH